MPLLAQIPSGGNPPPLPAAPVLERVFLENPLPVVGALAIAAFVAVVVLNRQGRPRRALLAGGAFLAAALLLYAVARAIETPRERIMAETVRLVEATAAVDIAALDRLLDPETRAFYVRAPSGIAKERILAAVAEHVGREYPVAGHSISRLQATIDGPNTGRSQLLVSVRVDAGGGEIPFASWWLLDFRKSAGGDWRVTQIQPLHPWIAAPGAPR